MTHVPVERCRLSSHPRFSNDEIKGDRKGARKINRRENTRQSKFEHGKTLSRRGQGEAHRFTTRIDTIYGVTFWLLAPEHELFQNHDTGTESRIDKYVEVAKTARTRKNDEVKRITGAFTGASRSTV